MKKIVGIILILVIIIPILVVPSNILANNNRTLQDLIDDLESKRAKLKAVNEDKTLTKERINSIKDNVARISKEIYDIEQNMEKIKLEIIQLNDDILEKEEEIKTVVSQYQLTDGGNAYLEYIFGASTVTDFIYRVAIVEQITTYNNEMIDKMNALIDESERKTKELASEKINQTNKQKNLEQEQLKLGDRVEKLVADELTLLEEINDAITTIEMYKKNYNCKPHQKIRDCINFPIDANFVRPLERGVITSNFGWRSSPVSGVDLSWHSGIDIGGNATGTPVYPMANGKVVLVNYNRCGGNYVIIQHNIKGSYYASRYMHLDSVKVRVGQEVTKTTVVGGVGGGNFNKDICSTGPHLDFTIARGLYGSDFVSFSRTGPIVNPRELINFPALGTWYSGRYW